MGLVEAVEKSTPEGALRARFGDDEICVLLPATNPEEAYAIAETVLGVAGYPEHGNNPGEFVASVLWALKTAKRVGGGGIVVAR